jgi:rhodanese-related sulfurtransferase
MITRILYTTFLIFFLYSIHTWCYSDVTPSEVYARLTNGDTLILLDVREALEYRYDHIAEPNGYLPITPVNMPWNSNVLQTEYVRLPINVDIIVYCQSGGRSAAASAFLESNGFTQIYNMLGGFGAWTFDKRDGGYGDHSGKWVHANDPVPVNIICTGSGDTSNIIFPSSALTGQDSIYVELQFASNKPFLPPNIPQSDMEGLFRVTALDQFGFTLFDGDSLILNDTVNIKLIPDFHSNIVFYPALKIFVPNEGWRFIESNFIIPAFYRLETILRRWYNGEGWFITDVKLFTQIPEQFQVQVFPNPFNNTINIVAPDDALIVIYDIRGRLIEELKSDVWSPDLSFGSGMYILNVHYKNQIINKKIVYLK